MGWITGAGSIARMVCPPLPPHCPPLISSFNFECRVPYGALLKWGDSIMFGGTAIFLGVALIVLFVGCSVLVLKTGKAPYT